MSTQIIGVQNLRAWNNPRSQTEMLHCMPMVARRATVRSNYKKFKGNCLFCGIQGHKQADCHKKKAAEKSGEEAPKTEKSGEEMPKQEGDNSHKKCWWCREKGHIAKDCPLKKKNQ